MLTLRRSPPDTPRTYALPTRVLAHWRRRSSAITSSTWGGGPGFKTPGLPAQLAAMRLLSRGVKRLPLRMGLRSSLHCRTQCLFPLSARPERLPRAGHGAMLEARPRPGDMTTGLSAHTEDRKIDTPHAFCPVP